MSEWDSFTHQLLQQQDIKEETANDNEEYHYDEIQVLKLYKPPQKVTNYENLVEFDIDASSILNVYEVLTAENYPEDNFLRNQMISSKKNLKLR
jgi:hypothetical protein